MILETRMCRCCGGGFDIDEVDFCFYEAMKVPAPTWCPKCRLVRRLAWHGYRILHKRTCDFTGEPIISTHSRHSSHKVYKQEVWWSDAWDPREYGREYDFSRPFFEQFNELFLETPLPALHTEYSRLANSEYCNAATDLKNCYLVFRTTNAEDSAYLSMIVDAKQSFDVSYSNYIELCYDSVELQRCFQVFYSQDCEDSHHVWFSRDLMGCSYCIGCANLRNQNYCIFNQPYARTEYEQKVEEFNFGSWEFLERFKEQVREFLGRESRPGFHGIKNVDVSGNYIFNSKNVHDSYMVRNAEEVRFSQFLKNGPTRHAYDYSVFSDGAEWIYESCWVGLHTSNVKFSVWNYRCHDVEYCFGCMGSGNCFGSVGIRKGEYCILNKPYSKSEYLELLPRIKEHMREVPYLDELGREYGYGELFPNEFSPWKYNESTAYEWWPLHKEEALQRGFLWRDEESHEYPKATTSIPDDIRDVSHDLSGAILSCVSCGKGFRLIARELDFYRQFTISVPRSCPLCRDRERVTRLHSLESSFCARS